MWRLCYSFGARRPRIIVMSKENSVAANEVRRLLRQARGGCLATLDRDSGHPYASLVNIATDVAGRPILFISRLA